MIIYSKECKEDIEYWEIFNEMVYKAYNYYPVLADQIIHIETSVFSIKNSDLTECNGTAGKVITKVGSKLERSYVIKLHVRSLHDTVKTMFHEMRHVWQYVTGYVEMEQGEYWDRSQEVDARAWATAFFNENKHLIVIPPDESDWKVCRTCAAQRSCDPEKMMTAVWRKGPLSRRVGCPTDLYNKNGCQWVHNFKDAPPPHCPYKSQHIESVEKQKQSNSNRCR